MREDPHPSHRFYVDIGGRMEAIFTEVSGLQTEVEDEKVVEGGLNTFVHRLPGRARVSGNLTLKQGMTSSNFLFDWCSKIARGEIKRENVSVILYDTTGKEVLRWDFISAYPVKWTGPQFQATGTTTAIETIELAYQELKLGAS
ncbi:MAG TPA: phage tail protein [Candidatus Sulfotelmatobacter sp.]|nr:phage tail protein [Candidatus Sulfotelmatobacter sp.]